MDIITANEIFALWDSGNKIKAIRMFRYDTHMELINAKNYLDQHHAAGKLFEQICADFVQNPADLLVIAKDERRKLDQHIHDLETRISSENTDQMYHNVFTNKIVDL